MYAFAPISTSSRSENDQYLQLFNVHFLLLSLLQIQSNYQPVPQITTRMIFEMLYLTEGN